MREFMNDFIILIELILYYEKNSSFYPDFIFDSMQWV